MPRSEAEPPLEATTCSKDAWARGSHQKVVAFSFFGAVNSSRNDERKYVQVGGRKVNSKLKTVIHIYEQLG